MWPFLCNINHTHTHTHARAHMHAHTSSSSSVSFTPLLSLLSTLGEAWAQLKKSLADEAEVHLKFSSKVIHQGFLHQRHACALYNICTYITHSEVFECCSVSVVVKSEHTFLLERKCTCKLSKLARTSRLLPYVRPVLLCGLFWLILKTSL